jgi:predicted metal-binding membrane protein
MASSAPDLTSRILRHERWVVAGSIALLIALSWWFLASGAGMGDAVAMPGMQPPLTALMLMWWLMMLAMMLPSAAPAILLYSRVRQVRGDDPQIAPTWLFLAAYLFVWLLFSVGAASLQHVLAGPSMALEQRSAAAILLIAAGAYQLSPLKAACLRECRSPAQFISRHWQPGIRGALRLGSLHGAYCLGCCWALMALLFVGGVMNFAWIAGLTVIVGIEKLASRGDLIGRAVGAGLIVWGGALLLS